MKMKKKYTKMVCWLTPGDENRLIKANTQNIPIVFTHSKSEFIANIEDNTYNVLSFQLAENDNNDLLYILRKFPKRIFNLFAIYDGEFTMQEYELTLKNNVSGGAYLVEELIENYFNSRWYI